MKQHNSIVVLVFVFALVILLGASVSPKSSNLPAIRQEVIEAIQTAIRHSEPRITSEILAVLNSTYQEAPQIKIEEKEEQVSVAEYIISPDDLLIWLIVEEGENS